MFKRCLYLLIFLQLFAAYFVRANEPECILQIRSFIREVYQDETLEPDSLDLYSQFYEPRVKDRSTEEIALLNEKMLQKINAMEIPTDLKYKNTFHPAEIASFHQHVKSYQVVQESMKVGKENKYDPRCMLGFCFGRAMVAHLDAVQNQNIHPNSVLKLWLVGNFKEGHWTHHVVTLVRSQDAAWYAVDPRMSAPLKLQDYFQEFSRHAGDRLILLPSQSDRLLSTKNHGAAKFRGTNESTFKLYADNELFLWQTFFRDALEEIDLK